MKLTNTSTLRYLSMVAVITCAAAAGTCERLDEFVCKSSKFTTLCNSILETGLDEIFVGSNSFTLFAPTDDAFRKLAPETLKDVLEDNSALTNLLQFHLVNGEQFSNDLRCTQLLTMFNNDDTRTVCRDGKVYQKGAGNSDNERPQIVETNIKACNGVIHVVNEVILPPPRSKVIRESCSNLVDTVCSKKGFSNWKFTTLCNSILETGLDEVLDGTDSFTLFAPIDDAFRKLPPDTLNAVDEDPSALTDMLQFHLVKGQKFSNDLKCTKLVTMLNGKDSRTVCRDGMMFQKGAGNSDNEKPAIIESDITACNGVIHVVNEVLLPPASHKDLQQPPSQVDEQSCFNLVDTICSTQTASMWKFATLCNSIVETGLDEMLDGADSFTLFAPTDEAFRKLSSKALNAVSENPSALTNLLKFHLVQGYKFFNDLKCTELVTMLNGKDTRTVCRDGMVYQKGAGNSDNERPAIIESDLKACNGVIHIVDEVLLPPPSQNVLPPPPPSRKGFQPPPSQVVEQSCSNLIDTVCNTQTDSTWNFATLCNSIVETGLKEMLDGAYSFTLFAPTDEAFRKLPPDTLNVVDENPSALTDLLKFHLVKGKQFYHDLKCTKLLTMLNDKDTRTVCRFGKVYQKGAGNSDTKRPEIVRSDITACNGVVHVVNEVLLPPPSHQIFLPPPSQGFQEQACSNLIDTVCNTNGFSTLCAAMMSVGFENLLDGPDKFTIFAPTNDAFDRLPPGQFESLLSDSSNLIDVLKFHVVEGEIFSSELACTELLPMLNGNGSRTVCRSDGIFQKGAGNSDDKKPKIIAFNLEACNGVIHIVNQVLLPPVVSDSKDNNIAENDIEENDVAVHSEKNSTMDGSNTQTDSSRDGSIQIDAISTGSTGQRSFRRSDTVFSFLMVVVLSLIH